MADEAKKPKKRRAKAPDPAPQAPFPFLISEPEPAGDGRRVSVRYLPRAVDQEAPVVLRLVYAAEHSQDLQIARLPDTVALLAPWADNARVLELVREDAHDVIRFAPNDASGVLVFLDPQASGLLHLEGRPPVLRTAAPTVPELFGAGHLPAGVQRTISLVQALPAARMAAQQARMMAAAATPSLPMLGTIGSPGAMGAAIAARYRVDQMLPLLPSSMHYERAPYPFRLEEAGPAGPFGFLQSPSTPFQATPPSVAGTLPSGSPGASPVLRASMRTPGQNAPPGIPAATPAPSSMPSAGVSTEPLPTPGFASPQGVELKGVAPAAPAETGILPAPPGVAPAQPFSAPAQPATATSPLYSQPGISRPGGSPAPAPSTPPGSADAPNVWGGPPGPPSVGEFSPGTPGGAPPSSPALQPDAPTTTSPLRASLQPIRSLREPTVGVPGSPETPAGAGIITKGVSFENPPSLPDAGTPALSTSLRASLQPAQGPLTDGGMPALPASPSPLGLPGQLGLQAQAAPRITGALSPAQVSLLGPGQAGLPSAVVPTAPPPAWQTAAMVAGGAGWLTAGAAAIPVIGQIAADAALAPVASPGFTPQPGSLLPASSAQTPLAPSTQRALFQQPASISTGETGGVSERASVTVRELGPSPRQSQENLPDSIESTVSVAPAGVPPTGGRSEQFAQRLIASRMLPTALITPPVAAQILSLAAEFLGTGTLPSAAAPVFTPGESQLPIPRMRLPAAPELGAPGTPQDLEGSSLASFAAGDATGALSATFTSGGRAASFQGPAVGMPGYLGMRAQTLPQIVGQAPQAAAPGLTPSGLSHAAPLTAGPGATFGGMAPVATPYDGTAVGPYAPPTPFLRSPYPGYDGFLTGAPTASAPPPQAGLFGSPVAAGLGSFMAVLGGGMLAGPAGAALGGLGALAAAGAFAARPPSDGASAVDGGSWQQATTPGMLFPGGAPSPRPAPAGLLPRTAGLLSTTAAAPFLGLAGLPPAPGFVPGVSPTAAAVSPLISVPSPPGPGASMPGLFGSPATPGANTWPAASPQMAGPGIVTPGALPGIPAGQHSDMGVPGPWSPVGVGPRSAMPLLGPGTAGFHPQEMASTGYYSPILDAPAPGLRDAGPRPPLHPAFLGATFPAGSPEGGSALDALHPLLGRSGIDFGGNPAGGPDNLPGTLPSVPISGLAPARKGVIPGGPGALANLMPQKHPAPEAGIGSHFPEMMRTMPATPTFAPHLITHPVPTSIAHPSPHLPTAAPGWLPSRGGFSAIGPAVWSDLSRRGRPLVIDPIHRPMPPLVRATGPARRSWPSPRPHAGTELPHVPLPLPHTMALRSPSAHLPTPHGGHDIPGPGPSFSPVERALAELSGMGAARPAMVLASVFREMADNASTSLQLAGTDRPRLGGESSAAPPTTPLASPTAVRMGMRGKGPSSMEVDLLARQVYGLVKRKLAMERERRGGF